MLPQIVAHFHFFDTSKFLLADGDNDSNSDSDDDSEDDVRGAVATTDDDCDEVSSYLSKGSGGAMDQIDELMRKASRETPTPPMDQRPHHLTGPQHTQDQGAWQNTHVQATLGPHRDA